MHWLARIILIILGNALALWLANMYVPGFILAATLWQLALIAFVLALLNFLLKPLLTLVLGPIIILTLGLGVIVVNAIILYLLPIITNHIDFLRGSITIQTIPALLFTTLIVSAVNFIIHLAV
jgi:putative membrane protein